jgi:CpeT protein
MRRSICPAPTLFLLLALSALVPDARAAGGTAKDLDRLAAWMTGSFSSAAQAQRDTSFFDIRLHAARIWPERTDGHWLYLEQARGDRLEQPYRQRVYHLTARPDGDFQSAVFLLPAPRRFVGGWQDPARFAGLTPDSLEAREGCAVVLRAKGKRFAGGTVGKNCLSELRGASYATSEVIVEKDLLRSLDRGWDSQGQQAWGSTAGPYEFRRDRGR